MLAVLSPSHLAAEDGARGIRQLLDDRIKREQTHTVDTLMLVQKAQKSEDACIKSKSRMHRFEEDTKRLSAEMFEAKHGAQPFTWKARSFAPYDWLRQ